MTPTISIELSESDEYVLMCTSYGRTSEAGPRILRAPPHPEIRWRHGDAVQAGKDADKLRAYFDGLGKGPSRTQVRKAGD